MIGWHHQLNRHELEQTPRDSEGQGSLMCCSCKKQDMTWCVNNKIITKTYSTIILDDLNTLSLKNNNKAENRLCDNFM